jgi:hypothetical protein
MDPAFLLGKNQLKGYYLQKHINFFKKYFAEQKIVVFLHPQ